MLLITLCRKGAGREAKIISQVDGCQCEGCAASGFRAGKAVQNLVQEVAGEVNQNSNGPSLPSSNSQNHSELRVTIRKGDKVWLLKNRTASR